MKISKATQWILLVGIFAILLVAASVTYGRQKEMYSKLNANIAQAQQNLVKYTAERENLERRRTEANSRVASAQSELGGYTESIEINEALFEAARDADVTITMLISSPPADEKINGISYRVFGLSVTAEGEVLPELLNFSNEISAKFASAAIEGVQIDFPKVTGEGQGEEKLTAMTLKLSIYFCEGGQ